MKLPEDSDAEAMALAERFAQCEQPVRDWAESQGYLALQANTCSVA